MNKADALTVNKKALSEMRELSETFFVELVQSKLNSICNRSILKVKKALPFDNFSEDLVELSKKIKGCEMADDFPWDSPMVLPVNTRYFEVHNGMTIIVLEDKPKIRITRFDESFCEAEYERSGYSGDWDDHPKNKAHNKTHFHLSFPYVVYVIVFGDDCYPILRVFYRTAPLTRDDDQLFLCHLPNIAPELNEDDSDYDPRADNKVCAAKGYNLSKNLANLCNDVIMDYWGSDFNNDYDDNWKEMEKEKNFKNIWIQEQMAEKNPGYALQAPWVESNQTLETLIENIKTWREEDLFDSLDGDFCKYRNDLRTKIEGKITESLRETIAQACSEIEGNPFADFFEKFANELFSAAQVHFQETATHYSPKTIRQFSIALRKALDTTTTNLLKADRHKS